MKWGHEAHLYVSEFFPRHKSFVARSGPTICDGLNNDCPVFLGQYNHTIDDKGRLAVPMKFREALARGAVVTRGLDSSLFLLPVEEWGKLATTIADLPLGQSNARAFARLMLAGAMDVALDKQGRCIVPEYLRQYAGLKKDVVIVGINTRLELWDAERWATYVAQTEKDAESIAEKLGELGI